MNLHKMIEICLKDDNMHIFVMINGLICINNYVITCIISYQGPDQLLIGNGSGLTIHSTGSSSLSSRSHPLKLSNILLVLEIRKKLISVYRLTNDNSVYVEFHSNYFVVKDEETGRPLL